jgi:hypothetical protein
MSPPRLHPLTLAGADELADGARRSRLGLRLVLGLLALTLAGAFLQAHRLSWRPSADTGAHRSSGVVVVDISGSTEGRGRAATRVALKALARSAGPGGRLGLVVFSDVAHSILPSTAPRASFADAVHRYLADRAPSAFGNGTAAPQASSPDDLTPLSMMFGGTEISTGLVAAERDLERSGIRGGHVYVISDLVDDVDDAHAFARVAARLRRKGIALDLIRVEGLGKPVPYWRLPGVSLVRPDELPTRLAASTGAATPAGARSPWPLALVALAVATALGVAALAGGFPRLRFAREEVIA